MQSSPKEPHRHQAGWRRRGIFTYRNLSLMCCSSKQIPDHPHGRLNPSPNEQIQAGRHCWEREPSPAPSQSTALRIVPTAPQRDLSWREGAHRNPAPLTFLGALLLQWRQLKLLSKLPATCFNHLKRNSLEPIVISKGASRQRVNH